ncbi:uncharacterized protein [Diadema setosum]|uniref:uncharacterized protein n=1 Tax=Diadema setosum TaxID=31175 RepID=UPI003B3BE81A
MNRRGSPLSNIVWQPSTGKARSMSSVMSRLQYSSAIVVLFMIVAILGFFCVALLLSNPGIEFVDYTLQSARQKLMFKIENLDVALESAEKRVKKIEGEKAALMSKLELVSKKYLDTRTECEKAGKSAKQVKTELDDRVHYAMSEASKAAVNYQHAMARAAEMEKTIKVLRSEKQQLHVENEELAVKLGKAIQRAEVAERDTNKLKALYGMQIDTPNGVLVLATTAHGSDVGNAERKRRVEVMSNDKVQDGRKETRARQSPQRKPSKFLHGNAATKVMTHRTVAPLSQRALRGNNKMFDAG